MPYASDAQRKWMHANKPELAKEFDSATPATAKLPERATNHKAAIARRYRARKELRDGPYTNS